MTVPSKVGRIIVARGVGLILSPMFIVGLFVEIFADH